MEMQDVLNVAVIWRGNNYVVEINPDASLKELGYKLQKLTDVKEDTMRLIVPRSSKLLSPFSDEHSSLSLREASITEGKSIRMMGATEDEVDNVQKNANADLRIAGFDEEEKRMRQRAQYRSHSSLKLPQGPYVFGDFRTLQLPGVELNPPASEALKRMHMLASDPGIVAIMNKHRWRVGVMTEMAPVGYVGVSPKCILGFNKNHGEEISLRLRTDDLMGFRKYNSIKKTFLHELAHMVYSEHDADFYALNRQLNQEAASLDWTKSKGHTLSKVKHSKEHEEDFEFEESKSFSQKLGGNVSNMLNSARASSVIAAYRRLADESTNSSGTSNINAEPDPDDSGENMSAEPDPDDFGININEKAEAVDSIGTENLEIESLSNNNSERMKFEPDDCNGCQTPLIDSEMSEVVAPSKTNDKLAANSREPDPDDNVEAKQDNFERGDIVKIDERDSMTIGREADTQLKDSYKEPDPDESQGHKIHQAEPNPDDEELRRIQDSVTVTCGRLQKAIQMLQVEVGSKEVTTAVLQTLFKIISNVISRPNDIKYKRLRKANPTIQKTILNYKAAMEILVLVGFNEDIVDTESYLVLKRNDPGLLWLARSSLEACIA